MWWCYRIHRQRAPTFNDKFASASLNLTAISSSCRWATELSGVLSLRVFLSCSSSWIRPLRSLIVASFSASCSLTLTSSSCRHCIISSFWASASCFVMISSREDCFELTISSKCIESERSSSCACSSWWVVSKWVCRRAVSSRWITKAVSSSSARETCPRTSRSARM